MSTINNNKNILLEITSQLVILLLIQVLSKSFKTKVIHLRV